MTFSWWHLGACVAGLISAVFFVLGIIGTERGWFEYSSGGATYTSGTMGGCVKFPGCDKCVFWKDRDANGTDPTNPACNPYTTSDWRPPSRWRVGGYVCIVFCVIGLIVALICVTLSGMMSFGILRGMKGSVLTMLCIAIVLSIVAWAVFIGCVRTSKWIESVTPTGIEINFSKKMQVKYSFVLVIIAAVFAGIGVACTALAPGKNQ